MEKFDEATLLEFREDLVIRSTAFFDLFVIMALEKVLANFKTHVSIGFYL